MTRAAAGIGRLIPFLSTWQNATDIVHTNWIGRWLSALFDTGSLILVYRLARRTFGRPVALLALTFATFTVLDIQLAHFYAVDTVLTFFVLLTLLGTVLVEQDGRWTGYLLTGFAFGAALATKTSAFVLVVPVCAAPILRLLGHGSNDRVSNRVRVGDESTPTGSRDRWPRPSDLSSALLHLLFALGTAIVVFIVCEPYALIDHARLLSDVQTQNGIIVNHTIPVPYTIQFVGTMPYVYYLKNLILWYLGPALGVTACAGALWMLWRGLRRKLQPGQGILLLWLVPYAIIVGRFWAKFGRYLLPIIPVLCICAAAFTIWVSIDCRNEGKGSAGWGLRP